MSKVYYNEHDPFAVAWLRELIREGVIAHGDVDDRDIEEVRARDLAGYAQHHFFAGIGGWSYALRLAGWPDDRAVWTGSCPCQPYSAAGRSQGDSDPRNLWPYWFRLWRQSRPDVGFGEQVAQAIGHGWLDTVSADLEAEGYAVGACVLGAHSVGAPHLRQRLYFVGELGNAECSPENIRSKASRSREAISQRGSISIMADRARDGRQEERQERGGRVARDSAQGRAAGLESGRGAGGVANDAIARRAVQPQWSAGPHGRQASQPRRLRDADRLGHADAARSQGRRERGDGTRERTAGAAGVAGTSKRVANSERDDGGPDVALGQAQGRDADGGLSPWAVVEWLPCKDGRYRPTQPGLQLLVDGFPNRVGTLRGAGNAIVPQLAAEFVRAYMYRSSDP